MQNGEIDIVQDPSTVEIPNIKGDKNLDLITYKGGALTYLAFNTKKAPADNEDLRKAVAYGIDIDSIIKVAAEGYGNKATSFWGWNEFGYSDFGGYTRDVAKAKEYVAKAYPNGGASLDISIGDSVRKTIAEMIQSQLKDVGIKVTITELDSAGISTSTTKGDHQSTIYGMGFNIFGDDARRILQPGSAVNKAHYESKEVMDLLDKAVAESDEAKRKEYYKQIQANVYEHTPYIPLYFPDGFIGVAKGTGGIDIYPTTHHDFSNVFVPAK
ncbi:Heme-binding protein A precursor [compost metagenome]